MLGFLPARLKPMLPGYRQRIERRHAALLDAIRAAVPTLAFGDDGATPWIAARDQNLKLYGFATEPANAELYDLLRPALPSGLKREYFRLAKDYVTRWLYPHMRPDLYLGNYSIDQLHGFHGQHKDTVCNITDAAARDRLTRAFQPAEDDVFIDCGAFLGFGSIRLGRDAPKGRVFAIEASGDCFALLKRNVDVNGAANVVPMHNGIWNDETDFALEKTYAQGNSLVPEVQAGSGQETVRTITVDGIVAKFSLDRLDMLSLTLNGAEIEALQGADKALSRLRPRIRAAGWYSRGDRRIADLLPPILEAYEYDVLVGPRGNVMALPREKA